MNQQELLMDLDDSSFCIWWYDERTNKCYVFEPYSEVKQALRALALNERVAQSDKQIHDEVDAKLRAIQEMQHGRLNLP